MDLIPVAWVHVPKQADDACGNSPNPRRCFLLPSRPRRNSGCDYDNEIERTDSNDREQRRTISTVEKGLPVLWRVMNNPSQKRKEKALNREDPTHEFTEYSHTPPLTKQAHRVVRLMQA